MDKGERDMPTKRFYRLSEEKRRIIQEAALHEFARVPFDKASINQIIKEAGISRGSFYTYFEDKWDVLSCIFEESRRVIVTTMQQEMESTGGDIWKMLETVLKKVITLSSGPERIQFVKNVMGHISSDAIFRNLQQKGVVESEAMEGEMTRWLYAHYSREKLSELDYKEFVAFYQMAMFSIAMEVKAYFEGKSMETIYESYRLKLALLKRGLCPSV